MSIPTDQYKPSLNRTGSFSAWLKSVIKIAMRLIGYFDLTEEDKVKAGIYLDYDR